MMDFGVPNDNYLMDIARSFTSYKTISRQDLLVSVCGGLLLEYYGFY